MKKFDIAFSFARAFADGIAIFGGLILAYLVRMFGYDVFGFEAPTTLVPFALHWAFSWKITLFLLLVLALNNRYDEEHFAPKNSANFFTLFWSFAAGLSLVVLFFFFSKTHFFSRLIFGLAWIFGFVFLVLADFGTRALKKRLWRRGFGNIKVIFVGDGKIAQKIKVRLKESLQFDFCAQISTKKIAEFETLLAKHEPDEVLVASDSLSDVKIGELAHIAHKNHIRFRFVPDELALDLAGVDIESFFGMPLLHLRATRLDGWFPFFKSVFDRVAATGLLLFLSPIFLGVSLLIWWEEKNPRIFYRSTRVGRNGDNFDCFKFRSMVLNADAIKKDLLKKNERKGGVLFKMKDDPRVTKVGKFIRKWSLDELPQLLNVILGDMSLVGPRPHLPEEVKKYSEDQRYLFTIKPGITGLAQVNGHANLSFEEEMKYELFYLKNWNFALDMYVLVKTIPVILKRKNF